MSTRNPVPLYDVCHLHVCVCVLHVYFVTLEKVLAGGGHTHRSVYTALVREEEGRGRACGFKTYEIIVYISSTYVCPPHTMCIVNWWHMTSFLLILMMYS